MDGGIVMRKGYTVRNAEILKGDNSVDVSYFKKEKLVYNFPFNSELHDIRDSNSIGIWKIKDIK